MLYRPSLSVTTLRDFSMRAGLAASAVTPGSTAPDVSRTTPAIPLADACCADTVPGSTDAHITMPRPRTTTPLRTMRSLLLDVPFPNCRHNGYPRHAARECVSRVSTVVKAD